MIPTIIPTAYKAKITASRGCVSSQATCSARLRPTGHFRIVARILDLDTDGNRAADDLRRASRIAACLRTRVILYQIRHAGSFQGDQDIVTTSVVDTNTKRDNVR